MLAKNRININKLIIRLDSITKTLILCHLYKRILMEILSGNKIQQRLFSSSFNQLLVHVARSFLIKGYG